MNRTRYVMTDENDIVVCNYEDVESYKNAGFTIFGSAVSEVELQEIIEIAEYS
ncbi:hypothetical protein ACH6EH_06890 [Paenibacillus sp. JSM ZJ436]